MILGLSILLLAGICQGSFGIGYKNFKPFSWEAFWGVYSLYCFIIPLIWCLVNVPDFMAYLTQKPSLTISAIGCGVLWGISAIGFSKAIVYIGMSSVYGLSMGISSIVGSVIPLITSDEKPDKLSLALLATGLLITLIGIAVITKAGIIRDRCKGEAERHPKMRLGILLSLLSGLGSGAMNIGFDRLSEVGRAVTSDGASQTGASAIQWLPVLFGGACAGMLYCAISMSRNQTWHTYIESGCLKRFGILFVTAIVWFAALALYGIASLELGNSGPTIGWIIFNALALIISNLWGLRFGEWKGFTNAKRTLLVGNAILIFAWIFIALSNV